MQESHRSVGLKSGWRKCRLGAESDRCDSGVARPRCMRIQSIARHLAELEHMEHGIENDSGCDRCKYGAAVNTNPPIAVGRCI